ncbi:MAG: hypothetical protein ABIJ16_12275 [Bacteroidota bacterium]
MSNEITNSCFWTGLILSGIIFASGCAAKHYSGETMGSKDTAIIHLYYNCSHVEKIDGADARPNAARGLIPIIGGGYFTMARSLSTDKAQVLPGEHTLGIAYRSETWWANPVSIKFVAKAGHEYRGNAALGEVISMPEIPAEYQKRKWDPFIEDITTGKIVGSTTTIMLQSIEPAKPVHLRCCD